jgi:hypothetical protein
MIEIRDLLQFSLNEVRLDDPNNESKVSFAALSYVWGSQHGDRQVECEGKALLVTKNCEDALKNLRYCNEHRILWVDAICIDQPSAEKSINERNDQVRIMGDIYGRTECLDMALRDLTTVLNWL